MTRRAVLLAALWLAAGAPAAVALAAEPAPWAHDVDVTLDPEGRSLRAIDRIVAGGSGTAGDPLRFQLHGGLRIGSATLDGREVTLTRVEAAGGPSHLVLWEGPVVGAGSRLEVRYEGTIHDPVAPEGGPGFVAGDSTTGIIGSEGIFLDGGTGWVPLVGASAASPPPLARYSMTTRIPDPWRAVTQGRAGVTRAVKGVSVARWEAEVTSEAPALSAGRYTPRSLDHKGIRLTAWFFAEESALADLFLRKAAEHIDQFSVELTPYPYSRFDIVENFFTTGYGFPSWTLLGRDVVRMGEMALRPGYLDHEIMHCWWGNYVYPDMGTGNWSEGLTTYFANYMAQERAGDEEAAAYRRNLAQKYALRVRPVEDYPLSRFREKKRDFENEIGYGKAAMLFHMLRRAVGDETFRSVMRGMVAQFGGRRAAWSDFQAAFEQAAGTRRAPSIAEWTARAGLPVVSLGEVSATRRGPGFQVKGTVAQGEDPYQLQLPLVVETMSGRREFTLEVKETSTPFLLEIDAYPIEILLDPDMHVLRALKDEEIPPCLNAVLEDPGRAVVAPPGDHSYGALMEAVGGPTPTAGTAGSLLLLGRPEENEMTRRLLPRLHPSVSVSAGGFTAGGRTWTGPEYSLLYSARHPDDPRRVVTVYLGMSPESLARARYVPYYGWDSWVVFKSGRVEARGTFDAAGPRSRRLLVQDVTAGIEAGPLLRDAVALSSAGMEGRRAGTPGHEQAAAYIERRLAEAGAAAGAIVAPFASGFRQPFTVAIPDVPAGVPAGSIQVKRASGTLSFDARLLAFAPPASMTGGGGLTGEVIFLDPEDLSWAAGADTLPSLPGEIVMTVERPSAAAPDGDPAGRLAEQIVGAGRLGASALIVLRPGDEPSAHEPLVTFASAPSAADAAEIEKRRRRGDFAGVDHYFAGRAGRLPFAGSLPEILVLSAGPELGAELLGRHAYARRAGEPTLLREAGFRPIMIDADMSVSAPLRRDTRDGVNLLGFLEGSDPALKQEVVIVGAHYDALGRAEDGALLPGASDNAAGVAALLELARLFADPARRPPRSLLLAAFDLEEWGLRGSRALVDRLAELSARPVAAVNIDSIGTGDPSRVYLIGGSREPRIRKLVTSAAPLVGLDASRDIDPWAFEAGSDHYPLHLAGLRSVGFFAADYASLHRSVDTPDRLNAEAMREVTRLAAMTVWALAN